MDDPKATHVYADFAGARRKFELTIGGCGELERRCNAGIGLIALRLSGHQFYQADVRETIYLGLCGGGMAELDATALMRATLEAVPLDTYLALAGDIVGAFLSGAAAMVGQKKTADGSSPPGT